jgi:transglutaminase-like putative cysteine protease
MRDALASLPIPARLLTALLLLLGALVAPHAANLNPLILAFFYTATLWRLIAQRRPDVMPRRWLLMLLMITGLVLVVSTTAVADGRLAGTALLVVMLGLKLLELRARRDIHVTVFLGYFLVLTQFLYDQSPWLAAYLFAGVAALMSIQVGLNRVNIELRQQLRNTLAMLAGALPLAVVVFLLFPRLQHPLWGISSAATLTGISNEMTLGNIGRLSRSEATAFRVRFLSDAPDPSQRYWRGPVLWQTDGVRWTSGLPARQAVSPGARLAPGVDYEITLEPTGEYWLFGLDVVIGPPADALLNGNYSLVSRQRVNQRLTYRATSDPNHAMLKLDDRERRMGLQLPERVSPRVIALVEQWQAATDPAQPLQLVEQALHYFREQPFVYTLSPGELQGDAVDRFLFETRRGFCEHYAGSFALLMRLAGIPSRVVVGYQGGERNPHADHWLVRQSDAHAWTEVWLPRLGWWRVDPTAAVAPERIEQPINAALSQNSDQVVFRLDDDGLVGSLWRNAQWLADAVDLGWYRWVVGFSADRQRGLFETIGLRDMKGIGLALALAIGGALAGTLVFLAAQVPHARRQDPLPALWQRLLLKLQRAGVRAPPWQGPDTICTVAAQAFPDASDQLMAINRMYVQLRYGRHADPRQIGALRRRIDRLRLKAGRTAVIRPAVRPR